MKICDAFTFCDELDLLEIRLREMSSLRVVHVLVEARQEYNGREKPLFYQQHKKRFREFARRIHHVIVDRLPVSENYWLAQRMQRQHFCLGWEDLGRLDVVLVSDVDEIPRAAALQRLLDESNWLESTEAAVLVMDHMCYALNGARSSPKRPCPEQWLGSVVAQFGGVLKRRWTGQGLRDLVGGQRRQEGLIYVPKAGWHFGWLGTPERLAAKLGRMSARAYDRPENRDPAKIARDVENGVWEFAGPERRRTVEYRGLGGLPACVAADQGHYAHLLRPPNSA